MKKTGILVCVLSFFLLFSGCDIGINQNKNTMGYTEAIYEEFNIVKSADTVIRDLEDNQLLNFSEWVHPEKGVRFSPYTYIDVNEHNVLSADDIINDVGQDYLWGYTDGRGDAIEMPISDYISQHVVTTGFLSAEEILINQDIARGNTLNNIDEVYPNRQSIEYYFSGFDPQYDGMDWQSLTLVFEEFEGRYYVVGIIHGSWTI